MYIDISKRAIHTAGRAVNSNYKLLSPAWTLPPILSPHIHLQLRLVITLNYQLPFLGDIESWPHFVRCLSHFVMHTHLFCKLTSMSLSVATASTECKSRRHLGRNNVINMRNTATKIALLRRTSIISKILKRGPLQLRNYWIPRMSNATTDLRIFKD